MPNYFFPQDWTPLTPEPGPEPLSASERTTGRDALIAAQSAKDSARSGAGLPREPLTWDEAMDAVRTALPDRTNDFLHEALEWAQGVWHPEGTSLYEVPEE